VPGLLSVNQGMGYQTRGRPRTPVELIDSIVGCEERTSRSLKIIFTLAGALIATLLAIGAVVTVIVIGRLSSIWVAAPAGVVAAAELMRTLRARDGRARGQ
jgi:hypothetical protein